jgi:all-trans-retinol 13,14-reductase
MYGTGHTIDQFNPIPATRIPGLLLAGQSVVAPGILGAVISAFLTCGFIIGHDTIREELIACA